MGEIAGQLVSYWLLFQAPIDLAQVLHVLVAVVFFLVYDLGHFYEPLMLAAQQGAFADTHAVLHVFRAAIDGFFLSMAQDGMEHFAQLALHFQ